MPKFPKDNRDSLESDIPAFKIGLIEGEREFEVELASIAAFSLDCSMRIGSAFTWQVILQYYCSRRVGHWMNQRLLNAS